MKRPFGNMYDSFSLFSSTTDEITHMSAGVNWIPASGAIKRIVSFEIEHDISYRNYGRSSGAKVVTDIVSFSERKIVGSREKISATLSNGGCDGVSIILSMLKKDGFINNGDNALMLGHSFPFYENLSTEFNFNYNEISTDSFHLPSLKLVELEIKKARPKLLFILIPHNPSGEIKSECYYASIIETCKLNNVKIILDRVCMMLWDYKPDLLRIFYNGILSGSVFVVDSLSKSDSLAGMRLGYILSAINYEKALLNEVQNRYLNPTVFSSPALAFCKLASLSYFTGVKYHRFLALILRFYKKKIWRDYTSDYKVNFNEEFFSSLFSEYSEQIKKCKERIDNNFSLLTKSVVNNEFMLDGGFNVLLCLPSMRADEESMDQYNLLTKKKIAVLTTSSFTIKDGYKFYYIRLGLTIPEDEFEHGLNQILSYYSSK